MLQEVRVSVSELHFGGFLCNDRLGRPQVSGTPCDGTPCFVLMPTPLVSLANRENAVDTDTDYPKVPEIRYILLYRTNEKKAFPAQIFPV